MKNKYPDRFKMLVRDEVIINKDQTEFQFFNDNLNDDFSVLDIKEEYIINWIINDKSVYKFLFAELLPRKYGKHLILTSIKQPLLTLVDQKSIGDIDLVAIPVDYPEFTTVIEFKRVKIRTDQKGVVNKNKLETIRKKGLKQIKKLSKLNFHRIFLGIIIQDDGRFIADKGTMFKTVNKSELHEIFDITYHKNLDDKSGVFYFIINQPTGRDFTKRYNLNLVVHKEPLTNEQSNEITSRVVELNNKYID